MPQVPLEERSQDSAEALERQLPRGEQQMLQAGDESFLALWKPANAPEAQRRGAADSRAPTESADWPKAVKPLRLKLPDIGWSTLEPEPADSKGCAAAGSGTAARPSQ